MARTSATAALLPLLLVLSLLAAVAHCRTVAVHAADPESTAGAAGGAVSDENGLSSSSSNPILPAEAAAASATTDEEEILPAEQQQHDHEFEFLRLPSSHRLHHRHRPCSLHRNLWWKRHHGVGVVSRDAPRRFQLHDHYSGHGERRDAAVSHLAVLPAEEAREAEEVKPVAEPDPDRSVPVDSDVEGEPSSFADADGHDGGESAAAVSRAWKKEMLRRWFHFHLHHGNGMRRHRLHQVHHHHHDDEEAPEGMNMKRFHFHHHDGEEDEEKNVMGNVEHGEDSDDEDEDEQVEEMVRRFRKAIMRRRRFGHGHGHGRRFFHHLHHDHSHRHAEEAENQQADGEEEESGGVMAWIKGLMNRF